MIKGKDFLGFIVLLAVVLLLNTINNELRMIATMLVVGGVVHLVTNSVRDGVIAGLLFGVVSYLPTLIRRMRGEVEGFEGNTETDDGDIMEMIESLEQDLDKAKKHSHEADLSDKDKDKLQSDKELEIGHEEGKASKKSSDKPAAETSPAVAQRETFRLINTVKQLDSTIKNLAPTLKQGKKILEAYEKIAFRK